MARLLTSQEYQSFRSNIPQKRICVDDHSGESTWTLYDAGPRSIRCPLVLLPPVSGRADVFFRQILTLSALGYRVIALDYPVYWTLNEFCNGLCSLLDHLHIDSVHLFGASLGGYLAQKFAEVTHKSSRVRSLILCNSFIDTTAFHLTGTVSTFWVMPAVMLKNLIMGNFESVSADAAIIDSIDFMSDVLDTLSQSELASRLTLNCCDGYVVPHKLQSLPVMIIDVNDRSALSEPVKEEVYKCYPDARRAQLKSGGNFPFLSRSDEVNLFLQIHLRQFADTPHRALEQTLTGPTEQS
jgi:maspardin